MRPIVKLLIGSLIAIVLSGCGELIFEQCITPKVEKPIYDNSRQSTLLGYAKQYKKNDLIKDEYIEKLEEANGVCK